MSAMNHITIRDQVPPGWRIPLVPLRVCCTVQWAKGTRRANKVQRYPRDNTARGWSSTGLCTDTRRFPANTMSGEEQDALGMQASSHVVPKPPAEIARVSLQAPIVIVFFHGTQRGDAPYRSFNASRRESCQKLSCKWEIAFPSPHLLGTTRLPRDGAVTGRVPPA